MQGELKILFRVMVEDQKTIKLSEILNDEKCVKMIKSKYMKGVRNAEILDYEDIDILIGKKSEIHEIVIPKKDFQDAMSFVEEYAEQKKLTKKDEQLEIVDIITI